MLTIERKLWNRTEMFETGKKWLCFFLNNENELARTLIIWVENFKPCGGDRCERVESGKLLQLGAQAFCFSLFCFLVKDTKFLGRKRQKFLLVDTCTKTVDSVEGVLWLATQTPNIFSNSPPSNSRGIGSRRYLYLIVPGINDVRLKSYFVLHFLTVLASTKTTSVSVLSSGYLPRRLEARLTSITSHR